MTDDDMGDTDEDEDEDDVYTEENWIFFLFFCFFCKKILRIGDQTVV